MRLVLSLAAFALIALPALAETSSPTTAPATTTPSPSTTKAPAAPAQHHRLTADERFAKANTTHDDYLTIAQAKTGYPTVARHFTEIDTANKAHVTENQIRTWEKAERERHHEGQQAAVPPTKR